MPAGARRKPVKVVVIGDEGVGKTSLVIAAVNESFPDKCPPVVPAAILPAEYTQEGVPLLITDTSSNLEERASLEQLCLGADVVMLVFDSARQHSLNRVSSYWMPELRRIGVHVPVILVGAKSDISRTQDISSVARPILSKFREIECVYDCSAKRLDNVSDVFYFALKAVTYPVAPVFDPHANDGLGALKPLCVRALKRVFLMNDKDKDGALSDAELNAFQVRCFATPLQPEELLGIRRVVRDEMPQGVSAAGLTLPGFLFLHAMFIERGRLETVWTVLRRYGYNDSLRLSEEHLSEVNFTHAPDQVVEMTEACRNFFSQKFVEYDRDGDKLLSVSEQADMFSVAPAGPWKSEEYRSLLVETGGEGSTALTLLGFLAKWAFTTAHDPVRTLAYVRYLGFEGPAAALFNISKARKQERKSEHLQRSVLQVHMFLGGDAGRGLLPRGLAGKFESLPDAGTTSSTTVAAGEVAGIDSSTSRSCTLILREYEHKALQALEKDPEVLATADVAAFTFSSGSVDSFRQAHEMLQRAAHASGETLPCVLVAIEDEQGMPKEVVDECGSVCAELELRQPVAVNPATQNDIPPLLQAFIQAAVRPEKALAIPQTPSLKARKQYHRTLRSAALYTAGGVAGGLLCYAVYIAYTSRRSSQELSSSRESPFKDAQ